MCVVYKQHQVSASSQCVEYKYNSHNQTIGYLGKKNPQERTLDYARFWNIVRCNMLYVVYIISICSKQYTVISVNTLVVFTTCCILLVHYLCVRYDVYTLVVCAVYSIYNLLYITSTLFMCAVRHIVNQSICTNCFYKNMHNLLK